MAINRLDKLSARRIDADLVEAKLENEVYRRIEQSQSVRYTIGAMQPIDPVYTKNTYAQGERVCNQLRKRLCQECEYEYQGSVTNDTHIKARSDIDILLLTSKFFTLEQPQQPKYPYKGDAVQDLIDLRIEAATCIDTAFPEATVDTSGGKCIAVSGGSLRRKIDVVPSNWFNSNKYAETNNLIYRGVQILDANKKIRLKNTPFLHNAWIDYKDKETNGGLRKAARLMKSLKYDTESISLSSYDIVSLAFNMPTEWLNVPRGLELSLLYSCHRFCTELQNNESTRQSLVVPDGHRKIFTEGHATTRGLDEMRRALKDLIDDVVHENARSFQRLAEARIDY